LSYEVDPNFLIQLLGILGEMIYDNSANQKFMSGEFDFIVVVCCTDVLTVYFLFSLMTLCLVFQSMALV
jgi:hypothetical protein